MSQANQARDKMMTKFGTAAALCSIEKMQEILGLSNYTELMEQAKRDIQEILNNSKSN